MIHPEPHPLAFKKIAVALKGEPFEELSDRVVVEVLDWWSRAHEDNEFTGDGPQVFRSNAAAAMIYEVRAQRAGLPLDDDVIYVKLNQHGYILHSSEVGTTTFPRPPRRCSHTA